VPRITRLSRSVSSSAFLPVKCGLREGSSADQIRWKPLGVAGMTSSRTGGPAPAEPRCAVSALFCASQAACHKDRNFAVSPLRAFIIPFRESQRGTRELLKTLWTVEELTSCPDLFAMVRVEGRPAARCSRRRRSNSSATGPSGVGSRPVSATVLSSTCARAVQVCQSSDTRAMCSPLPRGADAKRPLRLRVVHVELTVRYLEPCLRRELVHDPTGGAQMSAPLATVPDKGSRSPPKQHGRCFGPSAVLITETNPIRRSSGGCYPTRPGRERNAGVARRWRARAGPVGNRK
jgi:hypothetical protein